MKASLISTRSGAWSNLLRHRVEARAHRQRLHRLTICRRTIKHHSPCDAHAPFSLSFSPSLSVLHFLSVSSDSSHSLLTLLFLMPFPLCVLTLAISRLAFLSLSLFILALSFSSFISHMCDGYGLQSAKKSYLLGTNRLHTKTYRKSPKPP